MDISIEKTRDSEREKKTYKQFRTLGMVCMCVRDGFERERERQQLEKKYTKSIETMRH